MLRSRRLRKLACAADVLWAVKDVIVRVVAEALRVTGVGNMVSLMRNAEVRESIWQSQ